jgi:arsenate reductase
MAQGFARTYGSDVLAPESAGLFPAVSVSRLTREVMGEKNIDLSNHFPKGLGEVAWPSFDIVVNMSGMMLPQETRARVLHWDVPDPIGGEKAEFERVAGRIEMLVMQLILELRKERPGSREARGGGPARI